MKQHFATGDFGDDHNVNKDTKTDGVKTDTTRRPRLSLLQLVLRLRKRTK